MKRRTVLKGLLGAIPMSLTSYSQAAALISQLSITEDGVQFEPTWASLQQYRVPDWYRNAKFGMRAHWSARFDNQPDAGPSGNLNKWKAEKWLPEELVTLYKAAGARYFVALANDEDNVDLFNSKHHALNTMRAGPKKDIIANWLKAARNQGLYFGASLHASAAYTKLQTAADASSAFSENFLKRTTDLIDQYEPDLLFFDDTALPFWPSNDSGLRIAAHFYNKSIFRKGKVQAVISSWRPDETQRKCLVANAAAQEITAIEQLPWQYNLSLGKLHYDKSVYDRHQYLQAQTVIANLADVASKNGNLLLNVPIRSDGTIDSDERTILEVIGKWMSTYGECIYDTRPWKVCAEGSPVLSTSGQPDTDANKALRFNAGDIRYTCKGRHIYAIAFVTPADQKLVLKSAGTATGHIPGDIARVVLAGNNLNLEFSRSADALTISLPSSLAGDLPFAIKITTSGIANNS